MLNKGFITHIQINEPLNTSRRFSTCLWSRKIYKNEVQFQSKFIVSMRIMKLCIKKHVTYITVTFEKKVTNG